MHKLAHTYCKILITCSTNLAKEECSSENGEYHPDNLDCWLWFRVASNLRKYGINGIHFTSRIFHSSKDYWFGAWSALPKNVEKGKYNFNQLNKFLCKTFLPNSSYYWVRSVCFILCECGFWCSDSCWRIENSFCFWVKN